jgi:translation initiation factor 3 subunit J
LKKVGLGDDAPKFDDEEDLAVSEKARLEKVATQELKKKGNALTAKKQAEQDRKDEEEIARKAMELEAEMEASMTPDELRTMKRRQIEEADNALTDDLFGGIDNKVSAANSAAVGGGAGGPLVLKDLKDHLKHARKVSTVIKVRL